MRIIKISALFSCLIPLLLLNGCESMFKNVVRSTLRSLSESTMPTERASFSGIIMVYNKDGAKIPLMGNLEKREGILPDISMSENGFLRALFSQTGDETAFGEPSWKVNKNSLTKKLEIDIDKIKAGENKIEYCSYKLPDSLGLSEIISFLKNEFDEESVFEIGQGDYTIAWKKENDNIAYIIQNENYYGFAIASIQYQTEPGALNFLGGGVQELYAKRLTYYSLNESKKAVPEMANRLNDNTVSSNKKENLNIEKSNIGNNEKNIPNESKKVETQNPPKIENKQNANLVTNQKVEIKPIETIKVIENRKKAIKDDELNIYIIQVFASKDKSKAIKHVNTIKSKFPEINEIVIEEENSIFKIRITTRSNNDRIQDLIYKLFDAGYKGIFIL